MGFALTALASPYSSDTIRLSDLAGGAVQPHVQILEDDTRSLDLDDALKQFQLGLFKKEDAGFNLGYSRSRYWVYFGFSVPDISPEQRQKELFLQFGYPHLDQFSVFRGVNDEAPTHWVTLGDNLPFNARLVKNSRFLVPEVVERGNIYHYWVLLETTSSVQLHPAVWDKQRYLEESYLQTVVFGMFYGILLVMALYNAFIGFSIHDKAYIYYVGYIVSFLMLQASIVGHGFEFFWPSIPLLNNIAIPIFVLLSIVFSANFSREFLRLDKHSPRLNMALQMLVVAGLICGVMFIVLEYQQRMLLAILLSFVNTALILMAGFVSWRKGFRYARLFLLAWVTLLVAAVVVSLTPLGYLPSTWLTRHVGQVGSAIEVVLLSLALADRINRLKADARALELRSKLVLKKTNLELQQALKLITKNNNLKDEFLATISHELRTPMNGVEGSLQIIQDEITDKNIKGHVEAATNSANHMTQLVDSLLEYSEIQSGNWKLQEQPFSIDAMLKKLISAIGNECERKRITFDIEKDLQVGHQLVGDSSRINHILFQLLDNAVKFTHDGKVRLSVSSQEREGSYELLFVVSDTGIGIGKKQLSDIFDGFKQMDGSFSRQYGGLGLGLSLCKAMTDKMGGQISVRSQVGEGTDVNVGIRLRKGDVLPALNKAPAATKLTGSPLVLIVEDNPVNQMTLKAIVKKIGCSVEMASNGEEAVVMAKEKKYDCILMDCQMPILDGFEATKLIRLEDNINHETSIIAVTANAMSGDRDRCLNAGMDDYIRKPVKKDIIFERLSFWLSHHAA